MSRFKFLALDIDGTILNSQGDIADGVTDAMQRAVDAGIRVTVCTGRGTASSRPIVSQLPINAPLILQGGGLIIERYDGKVLDYCNLPNSLALQAVRVFQSLSLFPIIYEGAPNGFHIYYDRRTIAPDPMNQYIQSEPQRAVAVDNLLVDVTEDPAVVCAVGLCDDIVPLTDCVKQMLPDANVFPEYSTWYPGNAWIYVFPRQASKGIALQKVTDQLGIPREAVAAIGDNLNDVDMLEFAGLGIAMENSPEEVKRVADVVTGSNDDHGLVHAIEEFILASCPAKTLLAIISADVMAGKWKCGPVSEEARQWD